MNILIKGFKIIETFYESYYKGPARARFIQHDIELRPFSAVGSVGRGRNTPQQIELYAEVWRSMAKITHLVNYVNEK